ncbi:hypothetical protein MJO29_002656, partial [Puccinia striiformis f. sp. tritici]
RQKEGARRDERPQDMDAHMYRNTSRSLFEHTIIHAIGNVGDTLSLGAAQAPHQSLQALGSKLPMSRDGKHRGVSPSLFGARLDGPAGGNGEKQTNGGWAPSSNAAKALELRSLRRSDFTRGLGHWYSVYTVSFILHQLYSQMLDDIGMRELETAFLVSSLRDKRTRGAMTFGATKEIDALEAKSHPLHQRKHFQDLLPGSSAQTKQRQRHPMIEAD